MDKTIDIYVNGSYLRKNHNRAGVQGEGNVTIMHIIFDESWAELAKKVTFWDSRGENPVERTLTADLLVDMSDSLLEYNVPIPAEPLIHEGYMTFIVDGYAGGKRKRSVQDTLMVDAAMIAEDAGEPVDPTPTQAEQLQEQIESLLSDVEEHALNAQAAEHEAANNAEEAKEQADRAEDSVSMAEEYAYMAKSYAVGGTNTRLGENTDNAKYYASIAKSVAGGDFVTPVELDKAFSVMKKVYIQPTEPIDNTEWLWLKTNVR